METTESKAIVDEAIIGDAAGDCQGGEEEVGESQHREEQVGESQRGDKAAVSARTVAT